MRILVACDLTARSDRALERGFRLARALGGELRVLHVVDAALPAALRQHALDWAQENLGRESDRLAALTGQRAVVQVTAGDPGLDIARAAGGGAADLLVLGVHPGAGSALKPFAETTAGRILRSSLTAALLVSGEAAQPYCSVVVGVDYSMHARAAIRQAVQVAPGARLHLVHAFHAPFKTRLGAAGVVDEYAYAQRLEFDAFLREEMALLGQRAGELGVLPGNLETIIEEGPPGEVLRAVAARVGAELTVIATHGRGVISRAVWGSVAEDLLGNPPGDVLVVKPF